MDKSILIVDDSPFMIGVLRKYLSHAGYSVRTAGNGLEGLHILRQDGPPLIITDCTMPEMDGLSFCRAVREDEGIGLAYILMLTSSEEPTNITTAFEAGADDYLTKPFNKEELIARISAGARLIQAREELQRERRQVYKFNAELATLNSRLEHMATTDELTGLGNRRTAINRIEEAWAASSRRGEPLACMVIDIDHFKRCNDTYGHEAGDCVLREVATMLRQATRADETVFRMGGEEFLVLCPDATSTPASIGAERLRAAVATRTVHYDDSKISATISIGVAHRTDSMTEPEELIRRADEALFEAKRTGRNKVMLWKSPDEPTDALAEALKIQQNQSETQERIPYKVLVVDDDPVCRKLCVHFLVNAGHEVIEADNGQAALAEVPRQRPDVVVMDVSMPEMDGIECTRRLKAHPSVNDIPVLIVSAKSEADDVVAGLNAGANEYITKPIKSREFTTRVETIAQSYRQTRQLRSAAVELAASNEVRAEQARAMGILFELSRALSLSESIDHILENLVDSAAQILLCHRVSIMLPDSDQTQLYVAKAIGIPEDEQAGIRVPVGDQVAGRVYSTREKIVANSRQELTVDSDGYRSPFYASLPLASVAMGTKSAVIGVLNATERYDRKPFTEQDLEYLELMSNIGASSIEQLRNRMAREEAQQSIVTGLATLAEYRDTDTGRHLERVTQYAILLGRELRECNEFASCIDDAFLDDLSRAMPLHDIGKVAVSDTILLKPGALTPEERKAVQRHTHLGARAIQAVIDRAPTTSFLDMAREIAHFHHERYDGAGYPTGLRGEAIPLPARIASVADVYDALTTRRPYKEAMPHEQALRVIEKGAGTQFDPRVVEAFLNRSEDISSLAAELKDESAPISDKEHDTTTQSAAV